MKGKPDWWPKNPYPEDVFPMTREDYVLYAPDPLLRTALSGCLGRLFWGLASDYIWEAYQNHLRDRGARWSDE